MCQSLGGAGRVAMGLLEEDAAESATGEGVIDFNHRLPRYLNMLNQFSRMVQASY
jgi:hypothetical protein